MDMFHFLNWSGENGQGRRAACVGDLGVDKKLKVLGDTGLEVETDKGLFTLEVRAWEPAWDMMGFVGVKLPNPVNGRDGALYFDPRITATLFDAHFLWAYGERTTYRPGKILKLYSEDEAWMVLHRMPYDGWSANVVCDMLTWIGLDGRPLTRDDHAVPGFEQKLWKLIMSHVPDQVELLTVGASKYVEERNMMFLRARMGHYAAVSHFRCEAKNHVEKDEEPLTEAEFITLTNRAVAKGYLGITREGVPSNDPCLVDTVGPGIRAALWTEEEKD